jgi:hypothetical protein
MFGDVWGCPEQEDDHYEEPVTEWYEETPEPFQDPGDVPRPVVVMEFHHSYRNGRWGLKVFAKRDHEGLILTPEYVAFHRVCTGHEPDAPGSFGAPCPRLEAAAGEAKREGSRASLAALLPALAADALSPEDAERLLPLFRTWVGRTRLVKCAMSDTNRPSLASWKGWPWDLDRVMHRAFNDLGKWEFVYMKIWPLMWNRVR